MNLRTITLLTLIALTTPLRAETAPDPAGGGIDFATLLSEDQVKAHCISGLADPSDTCTFEEFGDVGQVGSGVEGKHFVYARYKIVEKDFPTLRTLRVVIFERLPSGLQPAVAPGGDPAFVLFKPELIRSGGRILLHVPGYESGTGNFNRESLFVWSGKRSGDKKSGGGDWRIVDTTSWLDDLARRLPKGLSALKGIYPDYARMTAATALWRKDDSNACAEGGRAAIHLVWRGDAIALKDFHMVKALDCGEAPERKR
ncbi:hypothetical protein PY365_22130 [Roseiarcaceae bacterium H3SJ34-1]|uniref:hypothetical protein n=1 Tax=Terripilifer ovatus TaxID=3032367 RepID=UPI003AB94552|nr:hypothetical protein [Roseiarcaceae bacterium H3SJ34-1]